MNTKKPKQFWKDGAEAQAYLKEWQERLEINDWLIILRISLDVPKDGLGFCDPNFTLRVANIHVASRDCDKYKDNYLKSYQEFILIHELIHCIIPQLADPNGETSAEAWYNIMLHQVTERMARALFAAKYDLTPEWFYNNQ